MLVGQRRGQQNAQLPGLPSLACGQGGWAAAARGLSTSQGPVTFQQDCVLQEVWPLLPSQAQGCTEPEGRQAAGRRRPRYHGLVHTLFTSLSLSCFICEPGADGLLPVRKKDEDQCV